jgi:hypothetical protein
MTGKRDIRNWDNLHKPSLIPVSGWHDERTLTTFIPWSDVNLAAFGWQLVPHSSEHITLVYLHLTDEAGVVEVRCRRTDDALPDLDRDEVLGTVRIPT